MNFSTSNSIHTASPKRQFPVIMRRITSLILHKMIESRRLNNVTKECSQILVAEQKVIPR
jgi:hypothetical protein